MEETKKQSTVPYWIAAVITIILLLFCAFSFINAKNAEIEAEKAFDEAEKLMNETDADTDAILDEIADVEFETDLITEEQKELFDSIKEAQK